MRLILPLLAAGAALAAAQAAQAEPTFDLFQKVCVANRARADAVMGSPELAGWAPAPDALVEQLNRSRDGDVITGAQARMKSAAGVIQMVLAAHSNRIVPGRDVPADICAVAVMPGDAQALQAAAASYAAVPSDPALTDDKAGTAYGWRVVDGRHVPVTAGELAGAVDPSVTVLVSAAQGQLSLVGLAVPSK